MRHVIIAALALTLAACAPGGVRQPDGTYNLGPNALSDDPIHHLSYVDYPTYLASEEYLGDLPKMFPTKEQQVCALRAAYDYLPKYLQTDLNDFATNKRTFLESEYAALRNRAESHGNSPEIQRLVWDQIAAECRPVTS